MLCSKTYPSTAGYAYYNRHFDFSPNIYLILAALLAIRPTISMAKYENIISTIGRMPTTAAPIPTPAIPATETGYQLEIVFLWV